MTTLKRILKSQIGQCVAALVAGTLFGLWYGKDPGILAFLAGIPISLIKALATPLLFFAVVSGLLEEQITGAKARKMIIVSAINGSIAVVLSLLLVRWTNPGPAIQSLVVGLSTTSSTPKVGWLEAGKSLVPDSVLSPFVTNNVTAVLVLAILLGLALRRLRAQNYENLHVFQSVVTSALSLAVEAMHLVLKLMPLAIFCAVAKSIGENGLEVFKSLLIYVVLCIGAMFIHILIVYQSWIRLYARIPLSRFWRAAELPVLFAFGVNSSLATLPNTLRALDTLGVSKGSTRMGACVGTNFNNDGILLYEVTVVFMLAQAYGLEWSIAHALSVAGLCILATLGVSGFPEAGIVALTLVLSSAGLPVEVLPLLLPVDWLVARMRSATNVISDMTVSIALDGPPGVSATG